MENLENVKEDVEHGILKVETLPLVPDGRYNAMLIGLKAVKYQYGDSYILYFRVLDGQYAGTVLNGLAKATINRKSKLYRWLNALGIATVGVVKIPDFFNKATGIIETKTETIGFGDNVSNIIDIYPNASSSSSSSSSTAITDKPRYW